MAAPRIPTRPGDLRDVMMQACAAINTNPNWPLTAPNSAQVATEAQSIGVNLQQVMQLEAQLKAARGALQAAVDTGTETMKLIDYVTDGLYTPQGGQKANYGLPPKKPTHGGSVPLIKVVMRKVEDGAESASIFLDWEPVDGAAAYQVEWFSDAPMTARVGDKAVSGSEYTITGLTSGHQYWARVRAVRGEEGGPRSDPATRVANI